MLATNGVEQIHPIFNTFGWLVIYTGSYGYAFANIVRDLILSIYIVHGLRGKVPLPTSFLVPKLWWKTRGVVIVYSTIGDLGHRSLVRSDI